VTAQPRPPVVCLVGSSRFKPLFHQEGERLEKSGHLVLMMAFFQHADGVTVTDAERAVLEVVDRARIDLADEVLVLNGKVLKCRRCHHWHHDKVCACPLTACSRSLVPYVGESTWREIAYARSLGKKVRFLYPPEEGM
jgi:hypothetical protein